MNQTQQKEKVSVYLHIPFCIKRRKGEKPNLFPANRETRNLYLSALEKEIFAAGDLLEGREVSSLYVGGGIATVLSPDNLARMLVRFKRHYSVAFDLELTIRAAPQTLISPCLSGLSMCGFNRISIDALSASSKLLENLGASHRLGHLDDGYIMLDAFRIRNISGDILYGIPGQSWNALRNTLVCCAASPDQTHVNLLPYELAEQEGVPDEALLEHYTLARDFLESGGFKEYGAGRFARPGFECRFLLDEYEDVPRVGFGLGARSCVDGFAFQNTADLNAYIRHAPDYTKLISQSLELDAPAQQKRYAALRLQSSKGLGLDQFRERFGCAPNDEMLKSLTELAARGLLFETERGYAATAKGFVHIQKIQETLLA